jgi:hypothetical protein
MKERKFTSVETLLPHVFDLDYFHPNDKGKVAIEHTWVRGKGNFVVCLGRTPRARASSAGS